MGQTAVGVLFLVVLLTSCAAKGGSTGFEDTRDSGSAVDSAPPPAVTIRNASYTSGDGSMGYPGAFAHISFLLANDTAQDIQATSKLEIVAGAYDQSATFKGSAYCSQDEWLPRAHAKNLVTLIPDPPSSSGHSTLQAQCAGPNYPTLFDTFVFPDATYPAPMFSGPITVTLSGIFKDGSTWTATAMGMSL